MATFTHLIVFSLTLLLFNSNKFKLTHADELCSPSKSGNITNGIEEQGMNLYPLIDNERVEKMMVMNETRRKLGSFQICAPCTCCGAKGYCLPSPCCYAINCNIPNRPFGFVLSLLRFVIALVAIFELPLRGFDPTRVGN